MLEITIPAVEFYDEEKDLFSTPKEQVLKLEHSLVSLSKWESKWCKPFLSKEKKTVAESADYIRCMTVTQNVDDKVYVTLSQEIIDLVDEYIHAPMTATIFPVEGKSAKKQVITAEIIYHWMISYNIPFECQKWHLNRLLALINVCNIMNDPKKKMSKRELINRNKTLNEQRKAAQGTKG